MLILGLIAEAINPIETIRRMALLNTILKAFVGDKSEKDIKSITPLVNEIKGFENAMKDLSLDELRGKTFDFKARLEEESKSIEEEITALEIKISEIEDIDEKEHLYTEIDSLIDDKYAQEQETLNAISLKHLRLLKKQLSVLQIRLCSK